MSRAEEQSTTAVNAMCDRAALRGRIEALEANAKRLEHRLDAIRDAAAVIDDRQEPSINTTKGPNNEHNHC